MLLKSPFRAKRISAKPLFKRPSRSWKATRSTCPPFFGGASLVRDGEGRLYGRRTTMKLGRCYDAPETGGRCTPLRGLSPPTGQEVGGNLIPLVGAAIPMSQAG